LGELLQESKKTLLTDKELVVAFVGGMIACPHLIVKNDFKIGGRDLFFNGNTKSNEFGNKVGIVRGGIT
jgi:hypothetical protein